MLQSGPQPGKRNRFGLGHEHHPMGIAHRHRKDGELLSRGRQGQRLRHHGPAHIHGDLPDPALRHMQVQSPNPGQGLDGQAGLLGVALVKHIFAHAADAVAAHFSFAAVGVEDAHFKVGDPGGQNPDHAVGPGAEVPVRKPNGPLLRVLGVLV